MKNKGFTIVELLTVMAIIAILIGLFIPLFGVIKENEQSVSQLEEIELIEIEDNKILAKTGNSYRILLEPSFYSTTGPPKIFVKNIPDDAEIKFNIKDECHYLVWKPSERVEHTIIVITSCDEFNDEIEIIMEAY